MAKPQELIKQAAIYVEDCMSHFDGSHDFNHIKRVLSLSHQIYNQLTSSAPRPDLDLAAITLSALLHDAGDKKYLKPEQDEQTLVLKLLLSYGAEETLAQKVQMICLGVSYSSEIKDLQKVLDLIQQYPELAVVQDADRLDAIGAVGIGRLFTYGGAKTTRPMECTMEFMRGEGKLLKLEGMMKTEPGRILARERTERLLSFRGWWDREVESGQHVEGILNVSRV